MQPDSSRFGAARVRTKKLMHPRFRGAVTLSGKLAHDAKPYQEKQVRRAVEEVQE